LTRRKKMQKTIEVITVHGVGPHDDTFSQALERKVIAFLERNGLSSAKEIVHFTPVVWADIGRKTKKQLKDKIVLPITGLIEFPRTREFIVDSVGDILYYLSAEGKRRIKGRIRDNILKVGRRIRAADPEGRLWEDWDYWEGLGPEKAQKEWNKREFAYVSIIGHSLGSVITYDVSYDFYREMEMASSEEPWSPIKMLKLELSNLFTMGSPLALFSLLEDQTHYHDRPVQVREDGDWYNFYDRQDLIAYRLEHVYPEGKIRDISIDAGFLSDLMSSFLPHRAHSIYWRSERVAREVGLRLLHDYRELVEK
jgi:hypothetical protein